MIAAERGGGPALLLPGDEIVARGEAEQDDDARYGQNSEGRMKEPNEGDEHHRPRRVEECQHAFAAEEIAQVGDVLRPRVPATPGQAHVHGVAHHGSAELAVYPDADPAQDQPARLLQRAVDNDGEERGERQPQQGVHRAARQHPIVDLKHVDRSHQQQQIDHAAEQDEGQALAPDRRQRRVVKVSMAHGLPAVVSRSGGGRRPWFAHGRRKAASDKGNRAVIELPGAVDADREVGERIPGAAVRVTVEVVDLDREVEALVRRIDAFHEVEAADVELAADTRDQGEIVGGVSGQLDGVAGIATGYFRRQPGEVDLDGRMVEVR